MKPGDDAARQYFPKASLSTSLAGSTSLVPIDFFIRQDEAAPSDRLVNSRWTKVPLPGPRLILVMSRRPDFSCRPQSRHSGI